MVVIRHKFSNWKMSPECEIVFIGTFNPETVSNDFFYGSGHNFLWKLLPLAFGEDCLKRKTKEDKVAFIRSRKIDFIDLILSVDVEEGEEKKRADTYIDKRVVEWRNVIDELASLHSLKLVCFTRKRSSAVKNISENMLKIEKYLTGRAIPVVCIASPARYWNEDKQSKWKAILNSMPD